MKSFDFNRFSKVFWNSKLYIIFILALSLAIGYFYSYYYVTPMYQSFATVVLVQNENIEQEVPTYSSITQADINLNKNLLSTYTKIAKSDAILEQVIQDLHLDMTANELKSFVTVQSVNNTQVFKIGVANEDSNLAALITNHLLEVFSKEVKSLYNMNNIYTMDQAEVTGIPYNIHHMKDIAVFGVLGFVLSCILVSIIYLLDTTIKSEEDIEDYADLNVLSTIPIYNSKFGRHKSELIVNEEPKSPIAECFKTLRTNVMFSIQNKKLNTVLVTSGFMSEGKSFVSSNLAVAFANSGKRVILIDTDMRKGRIHNIFKLSNEQGLSTCLSKIGTCGSSLNINEFIKKTNITNLHVMTAGIVPPNPSELLSSSNMVKLLEALNRQYDVVICDGSPCMLVSDSIILSKIVDTTVIVTANKVTKLDTLLKIKKSIDMVGGNICGAIINMMDINKKAYKNNYYYGERRNSSFSSETHFVEDITLNTPLFVEDKPVIIENTKIDSNVSSTSISENESDIASNENLSAMSNTLYDNTQQISELKELYKDLIHTNLKLAKESNDNLILENFNTLKSDYTNTVKSQNNEIAELYKKLEDVQNSDLIDSILSKLDHLQNDYYNFVREQSKELIALHHKLEDINLKFELLGARANNNETLINNLSREIENIEPHNFDINDTDHKIIKISDYLEQYPNNKAIEPTIDENENIIKSSNIQDEFIEPIINQVEENDIVESFDELEENDIISPVMDKEEQDEISETVIEQESVVSMPIGMNSSIVDYETIKNKQKHKFSLFKSKEKSIIDEEPITIVSQILLNTNESVG